jgi:hypothetical protein
MDRVRSLLAGLAVAALPAVAGASVISFDLKPQKLFGHDTSGKDTLTEVYFTDNGWGVTFLEPTTPLNPLYYSTSAGQGTLYYNFFNVLTHDYTLKRGWNIVGDARQFADNSFQINTYEAIGTPSAVGADFALTYNAAPANNPKSELHWVQVVSDNNGIIFIGGQNQSFPGDRENKVDVKVTRTPYYDSDGAADSRNFYDAPRRKQVEFQNNWIASLFLVSGGLNPGTQQNPETITVYNGSGITWGWQNFFYPNVDRAGFKKDVLEDVFGQDQLGQFALDLNPDGGSQDQPVTADLINPGDYAPYEAAFLHAVPEPGVWAMMLVGFAWLGAAARAGASPIRRAR